MWSDFLVSFFGQISKSSKFRCIQKNKCKTSFFWHFFTQYNSCNDYNYYSTTAQTFTSWWLILFTQKWFSRADSQNNTRTGLIFDIIQTNRTMIQKSLIETGAAFGRMSCRFYCGLLIVWKFCSRRLRRQSVKLQNLTKIMFLKNWPKFSGRGYISSGETRNRTSIAVTLSCVQIHSITRE